MAPARVAGATASAVQAMGRQFWWEKNMGLTRMREATRKQRGPSWGALVSRLHTCAFGVCTHVRTFFTFSDDCEFFEYCEFTSGDFCRSRHNTTIRTSRSLSHMRWRDAVLLIFLMSKWVTKNEVSYFARAVNWFAIPNSLSSLHIHQWSIILALISVFSFGSVSVLCRRTHRPWIGPITEGMWQ